MKTILMDGNLVSNDISINLKEKKKIRPKLAILKINDNPATDVYIKNKIKKCKEFGIEVEVIKYNKDVNDSIIIDKINDLNNNKYINGIIVELPIYKNLDEYKIINAINSEKDVDGLTDINMTKLINNQECFVPCTVLGIEKLLKYYNIEIKGKKITIINRSNLIGKPLFFRLINNDCTVTICHSKSKNISKICKDSDIVITAIGIKKMIDDKYINENSIIIDAGIIKENNKIFGDVDFEKVNNNCSYLTKVPGGVGPVTIISLIENLYYAYSIQNKKGDNNG